MRFKCWSVAVIYELKRPGQPFHKGAEISAMTIVRRSANIGFGADNLKISCQENVLCGTNSL